MIEATTVVRPHATALPALVPIPEASRQWGGIGKTATYALIERHGVQIIRIGGRVAAWWRQSPSALPALATDSFWVLDLDHPTDGSHASIAPILNSIGLGCAVRSAGLIVHTARGGAHLYFARTPGCAVPPRPKDIGAGIDTRGHDAEGQAKSYIIAPGSIRPDGATYRIAYGALDEIGQAPRKLLAKAHFNRRERDVIAAMPELSEALCAASADCWRAIYEAHQTDVERKRLASQPARTIDDERPLRRQALTDLDDRVSRLAAARDGRKQEIFKAAASLAKYVAGHVLSESEVTAALLSAWTACGAATKHGTRYGAQQIAAGLKIGSRDPLPPIARRFR